VAQCVPLAHHGGPPNVPASGFEPPGQHLESAGVVPWQVPPGSLQLSIIPAQRQAPRCQREESIGIGGCGCPRWPLTENPGDDPEPLAVGLVVVGRAELRDQRRVRCLGCRNLGRRIVVVGIDGEVVQAFAHAVALQVAARGAVVVVDEDVLPTRRDQRLLEELRELAHLGVRDAPDLGFVAEAEARDVRAVLDLVDRPLCANASLRLLKKTQRERLHLRTPTCQPGIRPVAPPQYGSPMTPVLFGMQPPAQPLKSPVRNGVRRTRH